MATYESSYSLTSPWASMWQNTEADATVLNAMLLTKYGEQALDWDPLTIRLEIQDDFHVEPADEVMNKLCAMQIVMGSSDFFERIDTFLNVCNTLAEGDPFFEVFTPVEPEEIAFALTTVAVNRDMLPFSDTIRRYVKKALETDGFDVDNFPPVFSSVFDKKPSSKDVRHEVSEIVRSINTSSAAQINGKNIDEMLAQHIGHMFRQFNELPGLTHMDNTILSKGITASLGEMA